MTVEEKIKKFKDWEFKLSAYSMALSIINFDKMTVAPSGGNEYRDERTAFLAGELFSLSTNPEILELLADLVKEDIDPDTKRAVEIYHEEAEKSSRIPKDFYIDYQNVITTSHNYWLKAKTEDDYSIFEPHLKKVIEYTRKMYEYIDPTKDVYDQMLDNYEPGMTKAKYDVFFDKLREEIPDLIRRVGEAEQIDDSFLFVNYPVEGQREYMEHLLKYLHFDREWSYQGETEHPFTDFICKNDCRTTTKYLEDNVISGVLSTVHECGHAWYAHDIDARYDGGIFLSAISFAMHESQSRLCENYLGRTRAFWEANFDELKKVFPAQLMDIDLDKFMDAINVARPSLVRTEADELTYPLHIMIRYEIEKGLFDGTISTEGLDKTWNRMYKEYLGIDVTSDREGILQDDHWADGAIGYFPTYALGTAFAAQFMHKMRQDIDVDDLLRNSHYDKIMKWLEDHIHKYGRRYDADEVMKMATGEEFDPQYYIDYLKDKYETVYKLN